MKIKTTLTAGAIASVLVLGGCEMQDQRTPERVPETRPAPTEPAPTPAPTPTPDIERPAPGVPDRDRPDATGDDQRIEQEINRLLTEDEMLSPSARNIHVQVRNSVVTLHGQVDSEDEMNLVVERVWEVQGVMDVINELTIGQPT